jgi:heterodisulfide reductase subunit C|uniref:4Fe-4S ferredoxin-type domain-containing protein n=1 Tax=Desulfobacca acetoxidans TaxID=60893 RepID=A0A7C5AKB9_9BACT
MDEVLRLHELDPQFREEVAREPGCQHLWRCFSCGVCTATCPVAEVEPEFSPSRIIRQIMYGLRRPLLASRALWYCALCAQCSFACPQDVRFRDIIQGLRNLAVREGVVRPSQAARLAEGEKLIQELRRRFLTVLMSSTEEGVNLKAELFRVLKEVDLPSAGKE